MANRCSGSHCPYGYGHHDEHVAAAKLGWQRRRQGAAIYVERSFGNKYKLHMHPGGLFARPRYIMQDISDPSATFELSRAEFYEIAREVKAQERADTTQKSLFDKENNARLRKQQREAARFQRMREEEAERDRRRSTRFERDELFRSIREHIPRGIRPYKERNGRRPEHEEYQAVPAYFRARASDPHALTLDDAALQLSESAPWLGIHSADDLTQAFNRIKLHTLNERTRRRSA